MQKWKNNISVNKCYTFSLTDTYRSSKGSFKISPLVSYIVCEHGNILFLRAISL
jgi:hypothetical protein